MDGWLDECVAQVRGRMSSADEGSLWTLFFADPAGEPIVASAVEQAMNEMDLVLLRRLAEVATGVGATACLFAIIRRDGRPRTEDRKTWRDLQVLLRNGSTTLLGVVVVGETSWWAHMPDGGDLRSAS